MIKYFCDRCEGEIAPGEREGLIHINYETFPGPRALLPKPSPISHDRWLCRSCASEFKAWMKEPMKENTDDEDRNRRLATEPQVED